MLVYSLKMSIHLKLFDYAQTFWINSPTNPTLQLIDIARITSLLTIIHHIHLFSATADNTFLSPFYSSPVFLGADTVLHSLIKYINGHHAVLADKFCFLKNAFGVVPSVELRRFTYRFKRTVPMPWQSLKY